MDYGLIHGCYPWRRYEKNGFCDAGPFGLPGYDYPFGSIISFLRPRVRVPWFFPLWRFDGQRFDWRWGMVRLDNKTPLSRAAVELVSPPDELLDWQDEGVQILPMDGAADFVRDWMLRGVELQRFAHYFGKASYSANIDRFALDLHLCLTKGATVTDSGYVTFLVTSYPPVSVAVFAIILDFKRRRLLIHPLADLPTLYLTITKKLFLNEQFIGMRYVEMRYATTLMTSYFNAVKTNYSIFCRRRALQKIMDFFALQQPDMRAAAHFLETTGLVPVLSWSCPCLSLVYLSFNVDNYVLACRLCNGMDATLASLYDDGIDVRVYADDERENQDWRIGGLFRLCAVEDRPEVALSRVLRVEPDTARRIMELPDAPESAWWVAMLTGMVG